MNTQHFSPARAVLAASALMVSLLIAHAALARSPSIAARPQNAGIAAPAADIHDIRGPKPIPSPWLIPFVAATSLLALGAAYAAWAWNRRRFQVASKRPLDIALERLAKARLLMEPPRGREFSIEVSSAVRDFIESRFDLLATHLTTYEFLHQLLEPVDSLLAGHRSLLDNFLQTCDLAKFGGWNLAAADMEAMLESARQFIVASADENADERKSHERKSLRSAPAAAAADQSNASTSRETYVSLPSA